jgi:hypothetical protein
MDKIADNLRAAGVDVSTLEMFFQADMEEIHRLTVPVEQAIETWEKLRDLVSQTGCWPVLLGDDGDLVRLYEHLKHVRYPRAIRILEEAAAIDALEWFENRRLDEIDAMEQGADEQEDLQSWMVSVERLSVEGRFRGFPEGPWPASGQPTKSYQIPLDCAGGPLPRVHVGLVSTARGWEAPAFLRYGAWGECPSAAEHLAVGRFWGAEYGAEVVGMAGKAVEMKVAHPPKDRDDALELAAQQYLYCKGAVHPGTGTLQQLAATLIGGTVWYFWWD